MLHRRLAASLLAGTFLLAGCGGSDDLPTRAEFVQSVKDSMGNELTQLEGAGIDKAKAEQIFDDFLNCTYDKIKDNEQLLRDAAEKSGDAAVSEELTKKAADCTEALTQAAVSAATGG